MYAYRLCYLLYFQASVVFRTEPLHSRATYLHFCFLLLFSTSSHSSQFTVPLFSFLLYVTHISYICKPCFPTDYSLVVLGLPRDRDVTSSLTPWLLPFSASLLLQPSTRFTLSVLPEAVGGKQDAPSQQSIPDELTAVSLRKPHCLGRRGWCPDTVTRKPPP